MMDEKTKKWVETWKANQKRDELKAHNPEVKAAAAADARRIVRGR